jgi:hypothetical protein
MTLVDLSPAVGAARHPGRLSRCNGHPEERIDRPEFGRSRHWEGPGCTSAMWRVVDDGGIEQPDSGFLHQRTHALDPQGTAKRN